MPDLPKTHFKQSKIPAPKTQAKINKEDKEAKRDTKEIIKANKEFFEEIQKANKENSDRMEASLQTFARILGNEIYIGMTVINEIKQTEEAAAKDIIEKESIEKDPLSNTADQDQEMVDSANLTEQESQSLPNAQQSMDKSKGHKVILTATIFNTTLDKDSTISETSLVSNPNPVNYHKRRIHQYEENNQTS